MASPTSINSMAQFNGLLSSSTVVITDFYADWCGPCKAIAPVYEKLSQSLSKPNRVTFVKVNTDVQLEIAAKYQITAMPTFIIFRDSREINRIRGADPSGLQDAVRKATANVSAAPAVFATRGHTLGSPSSSSSSTSVKPGAPKWVSNGTLNSGRPLTVEMRGWGDVAGRFVGLYFTTLFSLNQDAAAEQSRYNISRDARDKWGPGGAPRTGHLRGGKVGPGVKGCTTGTCGI